MKIIKLDDPIVIRILKENGRTFTLPEGEALGFVGADYFKVTNPFVIEGQLWRARSRNLAYESNDTEFIKKLNEFEKIMNNYINTKEETPTLTG